MDYILESFAMMLGLKPRALATLRARFARKFGRTARDDLGRPPPRRSVRIPVLVVHDEEDNVAPIAQGAALRRGFRGALLLRTRGLGHSGGCATPTPSGRWWPSSASATRS